ncbi:MAG: glycosyltransferase [Nitrospina sp.]|jgi:chlorobactene glucosyltransferase|nr:glycosyltransferase [Nitrospina sp.]MBT6600113.1 glycosyltransferase [Nitrospina sp.]
MVPITIFQVLLIISIVIYLSLNMIYLIRLYPVKEKLVTYPYISVCIPARNEERDIKKCVESLLNQDYPNFEIIVVDDNSSDDTAKIVCSMLEEYSNLIFIAGAKLEPGWVGKSYALHQAYKKSRGQFFLFTDADLIYQPHAFKTAMQKMISSDIDLLTLMPAAIFGSFWERVVQPVIFGFIATLTNFKKVNSSGNKSAMGFGAFLLFKKESYQKIGGHQSVANEVLEDIMIAKKAKLNGLSVLVADGKSLFSIRMYHSMKEIWIGWRKNIFLAMGNSIFRAFYYMFMVLCFLLTPYIIVVYNLWVGIGLEWVCLSLFGLTLSLIVGICLCRELNLERKNVFLFPLGAIVMVGIILNSMVQTFLLGRTEWRGRTYNK